MHGSTITLVLLTSWLKFNLLEAKTDYELIKLSSKINSGGEISQSEFCFIWQ